ncbi:unnamed protein product [Heligmosomoides polygyrus]|uniref:DUF1508 domain-containing protein n=1 Tax=Heligmosomoides polygyrus TaxID=6339 RepID=A0A183FVX6_HELPZ|nr:unnamed protein product [Heligmosomoides polygyrus]
MGYRSEFVFVMEDRNNGWSACILLAHVRGNQIRLAQSTDRDTALAVLNSVVSDRNHTRMNPPTIVSTSCQNPGILSDILEGRNVLEDYPFRCDTFERTGGQP